jgi:hypothetical protein
MSVDPTIQKPKHAVCIFMSTIEMLQLLCKSTQQIGKFLIEGFQKDSEVTLVEYSALRMGFFFTVEHPDFEEVEVGVAAPMVPNKLVWRKSRTQAKKG